MVIYLSLEYRSIKSSIKREHCEKHHKNQNYTILLCLLSFKGLCVEVDIEYGGTGVTDIEHIATWQDCSEECRKNNACAAWTWLSKTYTEKALHGKCILTDGDFLSGRTTKTGAVSGAKSCGGSFKVTCGRLKDTLHISLMIINPNMMSICYG